MKHTRTITDKHSESSTTSAVETGRVAGEARVPAESGGGCVSGSSAPLPVIRGAKCQVEGTIDWFRSSIDGCELLDAVTFKLGESFGMWREGRGRHSYELGRKYANGAELWFTPGGGMCVDLPGGALSSLAWIDKVELLTWLLAHGMHCTRIDIAIDYRVEPSAPAESGAGITLIEDARRSAEARELCRCRTWEPKDKFSDAERIAHGINFGGRGDAGSGRYVRVYDKGLQTGDCPAGQWVRWEAEFSNASSPVAVRTAVELLASDDPASLLRPLALGCVDFRENTGDAHLNRRPRVKWFADLLEGQHPVRVSPPRKTSTLDSWSGAFRKQYAPGLLACAALADCSPVDVVADLIADLQLKHDPHENQVACEYADELARRAGLVAKAG